jgi:hypothetical protein
MDDSLPSGWAYAQSGEVVTSTAKGAFIMKIATVGLDLAKTLFQVHGVDSQGHIVVRKQLRRADVLPFFAKLELCVVGM